MRKVFLAVLFAAVCWCALILPAQTVPNLVTAPVDESQVIPLRGNVHPLAQARYDRGAATGSAATGRLMLILGRSAGQQRALTQYLDDLQNPGSSVYHKWMTPAQYGAQFGISDADLSRVTAWLQSQGFKIEKLPAARNVIEFSGNLNQVQSAFHTAIHTFVVNGETHLANTSDPQIPATLAPVVAGVSPLNDFHAKPTMVAGPRARFDTSTGRIVPELTLSGGNTNYLFVDPSDVATIYDTPNRLLNPSYTGTATYDGTGVKLGIVGVSEFNTADVANYRMAFLGETSGTVKLPTVVVDGADPAINGAAIEALLDNEVAAGVAPGAKIYFYTSSDTDLSSGLFGAMYRAVDDNVVSILSISFGNCEAALGGSGNQALLELAEQAAAQGITETVSTGDAGSAGCDNFDTQATATQGLAVSGFASTPYAVAVGGTDFDVLSKSFATYVTATSSGTPPYYRTALKYIPEEPWNDSTSLNGDLKNNVAYKSSSGTGANIIAGSGGSSTIYAKPAFQTSLTPKDSARDLPDVSLLAGNLFYRAAWVICADNTAYMITDATFVDCLTANGQFTSTTSFGGAGGTSAAAPAFAAMMALVAQAHGSAADNYRLGQVDNVLYQLALNKYTAVFHDVATGNNSVACTAGSPDCNATNSFISGYNATSGYDLATGLGSVDAAALITNWTSVSPSSTTTSLTINGSTADYAGVHGKSLTFGVTVHPTTATGVAGLVDDANETAGGPQNNGQYPISLTAGTGSATYNGLPGGSYTVWARYGGDTANASSTSSPPIHVTISPESSTITESMSAYDWLTGAPLGTTNIPYGSLIFIDGQIAGTAEPNTTQGVATGSVTFTEGTATLGSAAVSVANLASFVSLGTIPGGAHSVVANYPGDPSFSKSSSQPVAFTVTPLATTMTINSGDQTVLPNQSGSIFFTGDTTWTPGVPPTGTVTASIGSKVLGTTSSLISSSGYNGAVHYVDFIGNISFDSNQLSTGLNTATVTYGGDSNYTPSSATFQIDSVAAGGGPAVSLPETLTVGPGATAFYPLSVSSTGGYTGFLSWGCDPVPTNSPSSCMSYGSPVPLTGSIDTLLIAIANTSTAGTYSANLQTFDNANSGIHVSQPVIIVVNSSAAPSLAVVNDGTLNVSPGGTAARTSWVSIIPNGGLGGQVNLSCTVTTTISNPQSAPTCTVPASVTLNGTSPAMADVQVSTTSATTPGNYSLAITATSASQPNVTATNNVPLMVTTAHSFALSSEGTVTVTAGATTGNTTGVMVTPLNGFSGPVSLECILEPTAFPLTGQTIPECSVPSSITVSAGTAATANVTITSKTANPFGLYVVYILAADTTSGTFGLANAVDLLLTGRPSFTLDHTSNITVTAGATSGNTTSISVTPRSGFTGTVNLVCAVTSSYLNPVDPPHCSLSPTTATVDNSGAAQGSTLTVTTTARTASSLVPIVRPSRLPGVAALAIVLLFGIGGKRRAWMRILGLLVVFLWIAAPGCGGGGGGGGGSTGTTPGTYQVMVTGTDAATGTVTAQTNVTVTVN